MIAIKNLKKSKPIADPKDYKQFLEHIKLDIKQSQLSAALCVAKELIMLYWRIGKAISHKMDAEGWGAKTIDRIANDLVKDFPGVAGFSARNLRYMRKFSIRYPTDNFAAAAAKLPWGHLMVILDKTKTAEEGLWYIHKSIENGWSRNMLALWIESNLHERQGKAPNNFKETLPKAQSDLAEQILKDPYNFGFLTLEEAYREKELEQGLIDHIQQLLLELGQGFAFVGRQVHISVGDKDYYLDLLFFHLKLRCYVVIELKAGDFDPRDLGQIGFYLAAVDNVLRHPEDRPTIGMLFCQTKNKVTVEYALSTTQKPISVAEYKLKIVESLPKELKRHLPTVEEIEAELAKGTSKSKSTRKVR